SDIPVGAAAGCAVNPQTITLFAQARGSALTFANPFATGAVNFYLFDPSTGRWSFICSGSTAVTDNPTVGTRAWIYSCSYTATQSALVAGYKIMAVGVDSSGRGLMTSQPG